MAARNRGMIAIPLMCPAPVACLALTLVFGPGIPVTGGSLTAGLLVNTVALRFIGSAVNYVDATEHRLAGLPVQSWAWPNLAAAVIAGIVTLALWL